MIRFACCVLLLCECSLPTCVAVIVCVPAATLALPIVLQQPPICSTSRARTNSIPFELNCRHCVCCARFRHAGCRSCRCRCWPRTAWRTPGRAFSRPCSNTCTCPGSPAHSMLSRRRLHPRLVLRLLSVRCASFLPPSFYMPCLENTLSIELTSCLNAAFDGSQQRAVRGRAGRARRVARAQLGLAAPALVSSCCVNGVCRILRFSGRRGLVFRSRISTICVWRAP